MDIRIQRALPVVLSIISSIGTVVTAVLVAKETPKFESGLKDIKKGDKKSEIKLALKTYTPAIAVGVATIASTVSATIIGKKTEASLAATAVMLSQGWNKYKYKVKEVLGEKVNNEITNGIADDEYKTNEKKLNTNYKDKQLYWEEHIGFFTAREADIASAMSDTNQRLHSPDPDVLRTFWFATLATFLKDAKADVFDKEKLKAAYNIGWEADYLGDVYGYENVWIHPQYTHVIDKETGEQKYIKISFWEDPIFIDTKAITSRYLEASTNSGTLEHNSEIDIQDYHKEHAHILGDPESDDIIQGGASSGNFKDSYNSDDMDYFMSSSQTSMDNNQTRYLDGSDPEDPNNRENLAELPDPKTVPAL